MSCELTLGRKEPCKDQVGGIVAVYFINFGDITAAYDTTGVTDIVNDLGAATAYKYEVRGANSSFTETITSSRDNGTTFFSQASQITLKKQDAETTEQVKLLAYGRPHIVIEDYNGNAWIAGIEHGCDLTEGSAQTGAAMGDLNGYALTFTGMERKPANFLKNSEVGDPFAGLSTSVTVVEGTNS